MEELSLMKLIQAVWCTDPQITSSVLENGIHRIISKTIRVRIALEISSTILHQAATRSSNPEVAFAVFHQYANVIALHCLDSTFVKDPEGHAIKAGQAFLCSHPE